MQGQEDLAEYEGPFQVILNVMMMVAWAQLVVMMMTFSWKGRIVDDDSDYNQLI